jgi:hypothetical protein
MMRCPVLSVCLSCTGSCLLMLLIGCQSVRREPSLSLWYGSPRWVVEKVRSARVFSGGGVVVMGTVGVIT